MQYEYHKCDWCGKKIEDEDKGHTLSIEAKKGMHDDISAEVDKVAYFAVHFCPNCYTSFTGAIDKHIHK